MSERRSLAPPLEPKLAQIAVENVNDAIAVLIPDGPTLSFGYVNPGFEKLFGYARSEVLGQPVGILAHGPLRPDGLLRVDFDPKNPHRGEAVLKTKAGEKVLAEIDLRTVDLEGLEGGVLVLRDVTAYRRLEQIAAASEVSESTGYLLAGIRHEVGNPLNSLKTTLTLLTDPSVELPAARRADYMSRALGEIKRMESLLEQMRTFNANETVQLGPVSVRHFFERLVRLVADDCAARATTIEVAEGAAATIVADSRVLHQTMVLLLTNALDAMESSRERRIVLGCDVDARSVRVWISDTGPGMTRDQIANAQRPFVTTKVKGTGLGLPIAHRYAHLMKCRLELASVVGEGTRCTLEFEQINSSES